MPQINIPTTSTSPRKLCFGGSFNPIHIGHLLVSRAVAEQKNFDRVVLIPSAVPPHKQQAAEMAAANHRLAMCQLVARNDPLFEVDDLELRRHGPSFTLDTAHELKRRGWTEVHWLIGADMLQFLPQWHRPLDLLREITFWIAKRPGHEIDWPTLPPQYRRLQSQVVTGPEIELSATEIRHRASENKPLRYMVPPEVEEYLKAHRVYPS
jgi:nicotinate-nucleotide adenylyltransferase